MALLPLLQEYVHPIGPLKMLPNVVLSDLTTLHLGIADGFGLKCQSQDCRQSFLSIITSLPKSAFSRANIISIWTSGSLDQRNPSDLIHFFWPLARNFCSLRLVFRVDVRHQGLFSYMHIWFVVLAITQPYSLIDVQWRATRQSLHAACVKSKEVHIPSSTSDNTLR